MKLPETLKHTIEIIGLITALAVDVIVIPICMVTIAPDYLTKAAFLAIGITIVFSVFLSWAKGQKTAWVVFALVVFFFDLSFALVATNVQTHKVDVSKDAEIVRIDGEILKAQTQIQKLREERTISTRPETIASITADIRNEEANVSGFKSDRTKREKELSATGGVYITADSVFNAVPDAIRSRRIIPLIIFSLIFLSLQAVVITSIDAPGKEKVDEVKNPLVKEKPAKQYQRLKTVTLEIWTLLVWMGERASPPNLRAPSDDLIKKWCTDKGYRFDESEHAERMDSAKSLRLISDTGRLLVSQAKALEAMRTALERTQTATVEKVQADAQQSLF
jgi:hypothetical protein